MVKPLLTQHMKPLFFVLIWFCSLSAKADFCEDLANLIYKSSGGCFTSTMGLDLNQRSFITIVDPDSLFAKKINACDKYEGRQLSMRILHSWNKSDRNEANVVPLYVKGITLSDGKYEVYLTAADCENLVFHFWVYEGTLKVEFVMSEKEIKN